MDGREKRRNAPLHMPFCELKDALANRGIKLAAPKSAVDPPLTDDELFRDAMSRVREISEFRKMSSLGRRLVLCPKPRPEQGTREALEEVVAGKTPINLSDTQEYVEWARPGCSPETLRRLREGLFSVQDYLDLHGMDVAGAEESVADFLRSSRRRGHRCVKIIHGRGLRSPNGPVLKNALVGWLSLRFRKIVVAFVTARQCDGGLGAIYILLK